MSKAEAKASTGTRRKLADEKILRAIYTNVPKAQQNRYVRLLRSQIADRHAGLDWAKEHPKAKPVTAADMREMAKLHDKHGVSFRALEGIYHLMPRSGMGAYDCVQKGRELIKGKKTPKRELAKA